MPNRQRRVSLALTCTLVLVFAALAGRLVYIHVASGEPLGRLADAQHYMRVPIRPWRGNVLDARLRVLAGSVETRSVFADPKVVADPAWAARQVGPVLGLPVDLVHRALVADPERRFVWLRRRVAPETARAIRDLGIHGIGLVPEGMRRYPNGALAAHVLGFVGSEEQGLEGLERLFDERLRGTEGRAFILADRSRRPIWTSPEHIQPAEDGQHLALTIDAVIQAAAEAAIAEACETFHAASASAIVMDPRTGWILAMANVPTFDPNEYAAFPADARRNRAVTDAYPPGSTAKPFLASAALAAGLVELGQSFYCENGYWPAHRLHDAGHHFQNLTFELIVIKSSNIGMAKIGLRLGNARLHAALGQFGFGRATGIWLPGECPGRVLPLARWTKYSTTRVPFGQEFTTTPLQLVTAFAAIANGGRLVRPRIVRGVLDHCGHPIVEFAEPEVVGQALDPATSREMIDRVLVGVVEEGTGKNCRIPGYRVFGKTGTAQGVDPDGSISHTRYVASFLAGAPADDPRVVVLVTVYEPDKAIGYYGGTVAAPAARKILEETLRYLGVAPDGPSAPRHGVHLVQHGF